MQRDGSVRDVFGKDMGHWRDNGIPPKREGEMACSMVPE
jgi:hypothetical protein